MLEGVLKVVKSQGSFGGEVGFNPWYVGGGVKRSILVSKAADGGGFNPWYVGGGVKSVELAKVSCEKKGFNPWYVGGGVKRANAPIPHHKAVPFQSLVCWRGC